MPTVTVPPLQSPPICQTSIYTALVAEQITLFFYPIEGGCTKKWSKSEKNSVTSFYSLAIGNIS